MKYVFISGISTAGKSYLAKRVAHKTGIIHISTDNLKEKMVEDPKLAPFVNFFRNIDENFLFLIIYTKKPSGVN